MYSPTYFLAVLKDGHCNCQEMEDNNFLVEVIATKLYSDLGISRDYKEEILGSVSKDGRSNLSFKFSRDGDLEKVEFPDVPPLHDLAVVVTYTKLPG
jgi:hypothetical protein